MRSHPYLNFDGKAEEAFEFYRSVFGGEFSRVMKTNDAPGSDSFPEEERNRIMHISLPLGDEVVLMGSDIYPSMGQQLSLGNNMYVLLNPDTKEEAVRIFERLSDGGDVEMPLEKQFWGDYFGSFKDKYGILWMVDVEE